MSTIQEKRAETLMFAIGVLALAYSFYVKFNDSFWADEFYSVYSTGRHADGMAALWSRWSRDMQPPLFYLLGTVWQHLVPLSEPWLRALNLVFAGIGLLLLTPALRLLPRRAVLLSAVSLALAPIFMTKALEFRPYGLQIGASFGLCLTLLSLRREADYGTRARAMRWAILIVFALTLAGSHFFAAFLSCALLGFSLLFQWPRWRPRERLLLGATLALAAAIPALWILAVSFDYVSHAVGGKFWIAVTPAQALIDIGKTFIRACAYNPLALFLIGAMVWRHRERAPLTADLAPCLAAVLALFAFTFAVNFKTPLVLERYYASILGPLAVVSGFTLDDFARRVRGGRALIIASLVFSLVFSLLRFASYSINDDLAYLKEKISECPSIRLIGYVERQWHEWGINPRQIAYEMTASKLGVPITRAYGAEALPPPDPVCGAILWAPGQIYWYDGVPAVHDNKSFAEFLRYAELDAGGFGRCKAVEPRRLSWEGYAFRCVP